MDDVESEDYNKWKSISKDEQNNPKVFWKSFERMKRSDHLYEVGIVVEHNTSPIEKGNGSAIFMHVYRSKGSPTAGCTAMSKEDMMGLIKWIDPSLNPLLIQVPTKNLETLEID